MWSACCESVWQLSFPPFLVSSVLATGLLGLLMWRARLPVGATLTGLLVGAYLVTDFYLILLHDLSWTDRELAWTLVRIWLRWLVAPICVVVAVGRRVPGPTPVRRDLMDRFSSCR